MNLVLNVISLVGRSIHHVFGEVLFTYICGFVSICLITQTLHQRGNSVLPSCSHNHRNFHEVLLHCCDLLILSADQYWLDFNIRLHDSIVACIHNVLPHK